MIAEATSPDTNLGIEKMQLLGLENQLLEARRQLAVLKETARVQARTPKECDCAVCQQDLSRELTPARTIASNQVGTGSSAELLKKTARFQTRRQQSGRPQALKSNCGNNAADPVFFEQETANTDGLLLAVDKFLSTRESHRSLASDC